MALLGAHEPLLSTHGAVNGRATTMNIFGMLGRHVLTGHVTFHE